MADANTLSSQARTLWNQVQSVLSGMGYNTVLTSAGRSASHNASIPGSSNTSQHIGGNAFDFQVYDARGNLVDPLAVQATLAQQGLTYGQSIAEYGLGMRGRNHLSVPTAKLQMQTLVARDGNYTRNAVQGARALGAQTAGWGREAISKAFDKLGLNPKIAEDISDTLHGVGQAMSDPVGTVVDATGLNAWLIRGSIAIVGGLLLAAAIFALANGSKGAIVKAVA